MALETRAGAAAWDRAAVAITPYDLVGQEVALRVLSIPGGDEGVSVVGGGGEDGVEAITQFYDHPPGRPMCGRCGIYDGAIASDFHIFYAFICFIFCFLFTFAKSLA